MCTHQGLRLGASLRFARLHALWQFDATQLNRFWGGCPEVRAVVSRSGWFADLARYGADGLLPDLDGALYWFIPDRCRPQRQSQTVEA